MRSPKGYIYVYRKKESAESAYLIKSGRVYVEVLEGLGFEVEGEDMLFGASEILLSREDNYAHYRILGLKVPHEIKYVKVAGDVIVDILNKYNIGFAIAKTIVLMLVEINKLLDIKKAEIGEKERITQEYCKTYANAIDELAKQYEQKRFPWLEELILRSKSSLIYSKGHAFVSLSKRQVTIDIKSADIDQYSRVYPPGALVCKEGDFGQELYILKRGRLNVSINNKDVTVISESGSVLGEMALLLGNKRTATLKALEETVLTVVKQSNLKDFIEKNPRFLINLILDLSRRLEKNCAILFELMGFIEQNNKIEESVPHALRENRYKVELQELRNTVKALQDRYDMDWIDAILQDINVNMRLLSS